MSTHFTMHKPNTFRVAALFLTLVASFAVAAHMAKAAPAPGSLIKRADNPALYYYASNGKRYVFPNEHVFRTWYSDFSNVQTVTADEMASIQIGGNVTYRPGFRMIKIDTDPKVYAISHGGVLRPIASEAVAMAIFGPGWASLIDDIPDAFFMNYAIGTPITSAASFNRDTELTSSKSINDDKTLGEVEHSTPLPPAPLASAACVADSWYCTQWNACSASGSQTRFCTKVLDCEGVDTPSPATTQSCGAVGASGGATCTADSWYCTQWNACTAEGEQTRFCTKVLDCEGVDTPSPTREQSCTPAAPTSGNTCTADSWYCTQWGSCSASGVKTRFCTMTVDCPNVTTPSPETSESCTPTTPPTGNTCTADSWYCTQWGSCSASGAQTRFCTMTVDCPYVTTPSPETTQSCTPSTPPTTSNTSCTADSWYCTQWDSCSASGSQTRFCTMTTDCPDVTTPSPATTQSCTPSTPPTTSNTSCTADSWYCTQWNVCSPSGEQTRFCTMTTDCPDVTTPSPSTTQSCTP